MWGLSLNGRDTGPTQDYGPDYDARPYPNLTHFGNNNLGQVPYGGSSCFPLSSDGVGHQLLCTWGSEQRRLHAPEVLRWAIRLARHLQLEWPGLHVVLMVVCTLPSQLAFGKPRHANLRGIVCGSDAARVFICRRQGASCSLRCGAAPGGGLSAMLEKAGNIRRFATLHSALRQISHFPPQSQLCM